MSSNESKREDDLPTRVTRWVEDAGFALELRVARACDRNQLEDTVQSFKYRDSLEGKWRELDVVSYCYAGHGMQKRRDRVVRLVIECKSSKKHPWVVLTDSSAWQNRDEAFDRALVHWASKHTAKKSWMALHGSPVHPGSTGGYAIAEAFAREDDRRGNDLNSPRRAVQQVLAGAVHLAERWDRTQPAPVGLVEFTLPIVVTAAPLFECTLSQDKQVQVVETSLTSLYAQPEGDAETVPVLVQIMTEDHFVGSWLPSLVETVKRMA